MSQQTIEVGASSNDGTGDPIRTAFIKVNNNFTELYGNLTYTPSNSGDWDSPVPSNFAEALDQLAARLRALE